MIGRGVRRRGKRQLGSRLRGRLSAERAQRASCSACWFERYETIGPAVQPFGRARLAAAEVLNATAARTSAFNDFSSIVSPSRKSIARLVLPSRLELKRPAGSSNDAPLAKVIFT